MDTQEFEVARQRLTEIFGSLSEFSNGNAVRCQRESKGIITLYRRKLAPGNRGEIAFHSESLALRAGKTALETLVFLRELKALTGRATERNLRYDWPRVGFSTIEEVQSIAARLRLFLGI